MKRASLLIFASLAVVSLCVVYVNRCTGKVLEQKRAISGEGLITIRELQRAPFTVAGLLGLGDCIHRCEYVPHPGWPSVCSISFIGESYSPSKITIEWSDFDSAKVSLDDQAVFYLVDGVWRTGDR
jgi:hypothetical protein